jgi:hypothetical protein
MKTRTKIMKRMTKKAEYGQFTSGNSVQGGWFIWLYDAVDVAEQLLKEVQGQMSGGEIKNES